uniref:kelch repeat and BTB domain-containing protein 11-like n=1 Tax=Monopterus albus TaxID=43700 RepID=UPI0009B32146|nr:kelch repeat and BTB domain-containing protein 11-like [Monopterus albus]
MEASEGEESGIPARDLPSHLGSAAPDMSQQISAENCYEVLTKAKSEGAEDVKERVYRYMSDHYLQVLRTPRMYGRLTAGERELILARRMEGTKVLAVAESSDVYDRGGSQENSRSQSPLLPSGSLFSRLLRYDPRRDEWEECPFNESRGRSTDMVAHRSLVYRFDVDRERAGVTVYKYNTVVKVWHGGASFPLDNPLPFRCAMLGDLIYCVNRSQMLQFEVREEREGFLPEVLRSPAEARGALMPFILCLNLDK